MVFRLVACQNKIYVIGGDNASYGYVNYLSTNEVYDPSTDSWETKKPMPTSREGVEANVVKGKIYVIGGVTDNYRSLSTPVNEVYDPATDSWTTKQPAPIAIIKGTSAVVDNKIYIMGGIGSNEILNAVSNKIYDIETDTWSLGASIPKAKCYAAAGATTGIVAPKRIYVMGGGFTEVTNVVNVYDPVLDAWSSGAPILTNRTCVALAVVNDVLYAIDGGFDYEEEYMKWPLTNVVEKYTPFEYGTIPPVISIVSPENKDYASSNVSLNFTLNRPVVSLSYSLDGQENTTIMGNTTLNGLLGGSHNITVYAKDVFGNIGASTPMTFNLIDPFPLTWIVATIAIIAMGGLITLGFISYRRKRSGSRKTS